MNHADNICVVTFPIQSSGTTPLNNLVSILCEVNNHVYIITGNEGYNSITNLNNIDVFNVNHAHNHNIFKRVIGYLHTQLKIAYYMFKVRKFVYCYFFFFGGEGLIIPFILAKLLKKRIISMPADYIIKYNSDTPSRVLMFISNITRYLSDKIIVYSLNLVTEWNLEPFSNKISIAHEHIINFEQFNIQNEYESRSNIIGYVGRLSPEKGIMNFINAIPSIISETDDLNVIIIGDGDIKQNIEQYLVETNLSSKVTIIGWVPHSELPYYFNKLKLIIVPSFTEGLPNVILESMACGTPVLATKVGAIPDIISNGKTGFLIEDNNPHSIALDVIKALNSSNLNSVSNDSFHFVKKEYTLKSAVLKYKSILISLR